MVLVADRRKFMEKLFSDRANSRQSSKKTGGSLLNIRLCFKKDRREFEVLFANDSYLFANNTAWYLFNMSDFGMEVYVRSLAGAFGSITVKVKLYGLKDGSLKLESK